MILLNGLNRRVWGTVALLATYGVLSFVPLPGVQAKQLAGSTHGLMTIGIATSTSAFVTVEFAALVWPGWRRLRTSRVGRSKLDRAVLILTLMLGLLQVSGAVLALQHLSDVDPTMAMLQGTAQLLVWLSLYSGLLIAFFMARAISSFGLFNGFSVLTLCEGLRPSNLRPDGGSAFPIANWVAHPWLAVCTLVLLVLATVACFLPRRAGADETNAAPSELPVPASSMQPYAIVVAMLSLPALLASIFPERKNALLPWIQVLYENQWPRAVLTAALGMLLLWAFSRASLVRAAYCLVFSPESATKLAQRAFRHSVAPTLLFLLALVFSDLALTRLFDISGISSVVVTGVAILLDFVAAIRLHRSGDWACAWRDPRPYIFPVVQRLLRGSDIAARELSLAQSTLFRVFAPFVLTEVWVPTERVAQATELIETAFRARSEPPSALDPIAPEPTPELALWRRRRLYVLGALAVLAYALAISAKH